MSNCTWVLTSLCPTVHKCIQGYAQLYMSIYKVMFNCTWVYTRLCSTVHEYIQGYVQLYMSIYKVVSNCKYTHIILCTHKWSYQWPCPSCCQKPYPTGSQLQMLVVLRGSSTRHGQNEGTWSVQQHYDTTLIWPHIIIILLFTCK